MTAASKKPEPRMMCRICWARWVESGQQRCKECQAIHIAKPDKK